MEASPKRIDLEIEHCKETIDYEEQHEHQIAQVVVAIHDVLVDQLAKESSGTFNRVLPRNYRDEVCKNTKGYKDQPERNVLSVQEKMLREQPERHQTQL